MKSSSRRAADARATFLVTDILADKAARAATFGLDSALVTRGFAAVKTGTSKDMRDNWCVGYTERYTVGVWVGNASGAAMHEVSGVSGAAPVWQALVGYLHQGRPSKPPPTPAGVVAQRVAFEVGHEPARDEWFIEGTAQARWQGSAQTASAAKAQRFGIRNPLDGSVYALDPDMPPQAQRITFEGEHGTWTLDGQRLGQGTNLPWAPWPGVHVLQLSAADGRLLQSVRFEVRGAGLKAVAPAQARKVSTGRP